MLTQYLVKLLIERGVYMSEGWELPPMGFFIANLACQFLQSSHLIWETRVSFKSFLNTIFVFKA